MLTSRVTPRAKVLAVVPMLTPTAEVVGVEVTVAEVAGHVAAISQDTLTTRYTSHDRWVAVVVTPLRH